MSKLDDFFNQGGNAKVEFSDLYRVLRKYHLLVNQKDDPAKMGRDELKLHIGKMLQQTGLPMKVKYEYFRGTFATWDKLFDQASAFATRIGKERLISISQSEDHSEGVVVVWYWDDEFSTPTLRDA